MNILRGFLLLGCIRCGLCQQTPSERFMAQVDEFCGTRCQGGGGSVVAPPRVGKAGPIGPPGMVDYGAINRNMTNMFTVLEESLNTRLENAIVEQSGRGSENIRQLQEVLEERLNTRQENATVEQFARGSQDIRQLQEEIGGLRRLVGFLLGQAGFNATSNGYTYSLITATNSWEEAAEDCRSKGAILISAGFRDLTARDEILDIMGSRPFWIGVSDIAQEGRWVWEDGVQSDGNDVGWNSGEPNDYGTGEDCGYFRKSGSGAWAANDMPCQTAYDFITHYLCEPAS